MTRWRKVGSDRAGLALVGAIVCVYITLLFWFPNEPVFWSPDEGGRYLDMRQVLVGSRLVNPLPYPGRVVDRELNHVPLQYWRQQDGEIYSWWPPTFPVISWVPYRLLGLRGLYVLPLLGGLLTSFVVYRCVADTSRGLGWMAMGVVALASPLAFYSFTFWEHTLATLLVSLACASVIQGWSNESFLWSAAGGFFLGLALYLRIESLMFVGAVGLVGLRWAWQQKSSRSAAKKALLGTSWFLALYLVTVAPLILSGPWDETHYLEEHYAISHRLRTQADYWHHDVVRRLPNLVVGSSAHGGVDFGLKLKWGATVATVLCCFGPWWVRRGWGAVPLLCSGVIIALGLAAWLDRTTYISIHGLIPVVPYIAFVGWSFHPLRTHPESLWGLLAVNGLFVYVLISIIAGWEGQGGLQWGPRYALPLVPIMIVATFRGVRHLIQEPTPSPLLKRGLLVSLILLILIGLGIQVRGLRLMKISKEQFASWQEELVSLPEDAMILTSSPVLALNLPQVHERRVILRVTERNSLPKEWIQRARRAGYKQVCRVEGFASGRLATSCSAIDVNHRRE